MIHLKIPLGGAVARRIFWGQRARALLIRRKALDRWYDSESKATEGRVE
jgi:hypothetical protein